MAIFKKKQTRVYIPNKRNATTRLNSLYGDDANIRYLEDRINNMRNVDAYTKAESDNRFARLANQNTFTENQTIKGSTAFIEFKDSSNARKGYIGKSSASSADVELKAETNSLTLGANHHVILKPGNNYQARYEKTPTEGVEIANKAYVDTKTGANKTILDQLDGRVSTNTRNIETNTNKVADLTTKVTTNKNNLDAHSTKITDLTTKVTKNVSDINDISTTLTDNVPRLKGNSPNQFTRDTKFFGDLEAYGFGSTPSNGETWGTFTDLKLNATVSESDGKNVVNVKHLNSKLSNYVKKSEISNNSGVTIKKVYGTEALSFNKTHIANGIYMYQINDYMSFPEYRDLIPNQRYEFLIRIRRIEGKKINLFIKALEGTTDSKGSISLPNYQFENNEVVFIWNYDLKPGGSGNTGRKNIEKGVLLIPIK